MWSLPQAIRCTFRTTGKIASGFRLRELRLLSAQCPDDVVGVALQLLTPFRTDTDSMPAAAEHCHDRRDPLFAVAVEARSIGLRPWFVEAAWVYLYTNFPGASVAEIFPSLRRIPKQASSALRTDGNVGSFLT